MCTASGCCACVLSFYAALVLLHMGLRVLCDAAGHCSKALQLLVVERQAAAAWVALVACRFATAARQLCTRLCRVVGSAFLLACFCVSVICRRGCGEQQASKNGLALLLLAGRVRYSALLRVCTFWGLVGKLDGKLCVASVCGLAAAHCTSRSLKVRLQGLCMNRISVQFWQLCRLLAGCPATFLFHLQQRSAALCTWFVQCSTRMCCLLILANPVVQLQLARHCWQVGEQDMGGIPCN
jgi:hypothetical protein